MFGKRPIAVDWAVPKKLYGVGSGAVVSADGNLNPLLNFSSQGFSLALRLHPNLSY